MFRRFRLLQQFQLLTGGNLPSNITSAFPPRQPPAIFQLCVSHACSAHLSGSGCHKIYTHTVRRGRLLRTPPGLSLATSFPNSQSFIKYCSVQGKLTLLHDGWMRSSIGFPNCPVNETGCLKGPLQLLRESLAAAGGVSSISPIFERRDNVGTRMFSSPLNTLLYQFYVSSSSAGSVILAVFYSDAATSRLSSVLDILILGATLIIGILSAFYRHPSAFPPICRTSNTDV